MTAIKAINVGELDVTKDISAVTTDFIDKVKAYIREIRNAQTDEYKQTEDQQLRKAYAEFFPYTLKWAKYTRSLYPNPNNHEEAGRLKTKGSNAVDHMQKNIVEFATTYMTIGCMQGVIEKEIEKTEAAKHKDVHWTANTGKMIAKNRKNREKLIEWDKVLVEGQNRLNKIAYKREAIEEAVAYLIGKRRRDSFMKSFYSGLRIADFERAKKALERIKDEKTRFALDKKKIQDAYYRIEQTGAEYIAFFKDNQDILSGQDKKLYLQPVEIKIILETNVKERKANEAFIQKYHRPFLTYQLKTLNHLRTKLLIIGSLESLMTLYIRMMRGVAEPLEDIKSVRLYESEVIEHVTYLLSSQFQEIVNINERIDEIKRNFNFTLEEYNELKGEV